MSVSRWRRVGVAAAVLAGTVAAPPAIAEAAGAASIVVVATRPDLVSGPRTLLAISATTAQSGPPRVTLDGVRASVRVHQLDPRHWQVLLDGLRPGRRTVRADLPSGASASTSLVDHRIGGPLFSGAQTQPWVCTTVEHGLDPATDAQCDAPSRVSYVYKNTATGTFLAYDPSAPPPAGLVATARSQNGRTVPYVVRVETGVQDRGIYQLAVLDRPGHYPLPWSPPPAWNHKLVWAFGGGCNSDHQQTDPDDANTVTVLDDQALSMGFAVQGSGLTTLGSNCNPVVSAEAVTMGKEHIVDQFGPIVATIGRGCSGGSIQQQFIAAAYPGLLDGLTVSCSFPDVLEVYDAANDCSLLDRYFAAHPQDWPAAQQDAVTGYPSPTVCASMDTLDITDPTANAEPGRGGYERRWMDPGYAASCLAGPSNTPKPPWVYDPTTNPDGVRCDLADYLVNQLGTRPDGAINRIYDNTGITYGRAALAAGTITPQQFIDLNAGVGGYDSEWAPTVDRSVADRAGLRNAYRSGLVDEAGLTANVPIIDLRTRDQDEIHQDVHSFVMRDRLIAAHGTAANQVIWRVEGEDTLPGDPVAVAAQFVYMDDWLTAIRADHSTRTLAQKVAADRPASVYSGCWLAGVEFTDPAMCDTAFPTFATPRIASGGPSTDDVLACPLRPMHRPEFGVPLTDAQWAQLRAVFPRGVCDSTQPAVGRTPTVPWSSY